MRESCWGGLCGGAGQSQDEKKTAVLVFKWSDLLADIENYAYVEGHVMSDGNAPGDIREHQHTLIDIGQEGNEERVARVLAKEHAKVLQMLYPYTHFDIEGGEAMSSKLKKPREFVVELEVPSAFSVTTLNYLSKVVHEYLVCMVLWDWMCITNPKGSEHWLAKAQSAESEIMRMKNLSGRKTRRPLNPF